MRHSISLAHIITNPNVHTHGKSERKVRKPKTIPDRDATTECTQILINITIVVVVHTKLQVSLRFMRYIGKPRNANVKRIMLVLTIDHFRLQP